MKRIFLVAIVGIVACQKPPAPQQAKTAEPEVFFDVDPATAGTLSGKILFTGKKTARTKIDMDEDPQCAHLHKTPVFNDPVAVNANGTLANVFIYIKSGLEGKHFRHSETPTVIDQKGCWFEPRVVGIQTGQIFKVTNSDPVTHNIHPRAEINRAWNQSQAPGAEPLTRKFIKPEIMIRVKCNIHNWMRAWIGVVDSPYFAVTGSDGSFTIPNIPPGTYTIEAWQEELGAQQQQITIEPSKKASVSFTFKGASQ